MKTDVFNYIINDIEKFYSFMGINYHFIKGSNIFRSDIVNGLTLFVTENYCKIKPAETEILANELTNYMIKNNHIKQIQENIWNLLYSGTIPVPNIVNDTENIEKNI